MIRWWPEKPPDGAAINISADVEPPWNRLSYEYQHGQIPIPGMHSMESECVMGIMEGLKAIGPKGKPGKINPGFFVGPGRERELKKEEWMIGYFFKGAVLNLVSAYKSILIPAYIWMIMNKCPGVVTRARILSKKCAEDGEDLIIYDGRSGNDSNDFERPLSAAAILVAYLNDELEEFTQGVTIQ